MTLNPFFLHGSQSEQRLLQELINEQLRMYGIEVLYIPRKFVRKETILKEVTSSKFDDNYAIEAYINNYDGYTGQGDILSKFGVSLRDELSLTISRERFEDFIAPFLNVDDSEIELASRPREGDLIYFPLGQRLFEVKFVEHENPFYQLGKLYTYELKCELFEYEDEEINTGIEDIQDAIKDVGYITTLTLVGFGTTATATAQTAATGSVGAIYLTNDGYNYSSTPVVTIDAPPVGGLRATAVAITTSLNGSQSIKEILITNAGFGYTVKPGIAITGGGGAGAAATVSIVDGAVYTFNILNQGKNYYVPPIVTISGPGVGKTASAIASISAGKVTGLRIVNAGYGYTQSPTVTISPPPVVGVGTYINDEEIVGSLSGTRAFIKSYKIQNGERILKISINTGRFIPGETVIGTASSASYHVKSFEDYDLYDKYAENDEIEAEADQLLDFSESNPFGNY